jgi:hypothetical protein
VEFLKLEIGEYADCVIKLYNNKDEWERVSKISLEFAREFLSTKTRREYSRFFIEQLVNAKDSLQGVST